jgi:DNA-binding MarR family transcriptional regulator
MSVYDLATYEPRKAVPGLIARVRMAFLDELDARLAPLDLKATDYVVLVTLATGDVETASSVCSVLAHDPGAMTRKIDALEKRAWRAACAARKTAAPSPRAHSRRQEAPPKALAAAVSMANEFLEGFTKAEVRALEGFLKRILENVEALTTVKG